MDIPKPMTAKNYDKLVSKFVTATKAVAEETMEDAAEEIRSKVNSDSDTIIMTHRYLKMVLGSVGAIHQ